MYHKEACDQGACSCGCQSHFSCLFDSHNEYKQNFLGGSHEGPTVGVGGLGTSVPPLLPFPFPLPLPLGMAPEALLDLVTLLDVAPSSSGSTSAGL